jgi:uncharacterized phage protein gp47/JayE
MPILSIPTYSQQIQKVRQRILENRKDISTLPGSVAGDLFVVPQALSDVQQFAVIYYDSASHSVLDLLALKSDTATLALLATALDVAVSDILTDISSQLDKLGSNVGETRLPPSKAAGTVFFGRIDPPATNITVPIGTIVRSSSGQTYTTTASVTMYAGPGAANYYNPQVSAFVIEAPVEATSAGSAGNTPAGTITSIVTPVAGLPLVTNLGILDGGRDQESDEAFGARILEKWQAVGKTTKAGVIDAVKKNANITDAYLASPGDPLLKRGIGVADLYIKDVTQESVTETFSGYNSDLFSDGIRPSQQPVLSVDSSDSGNPFLQKDTTTVLAGSVRAQDTIRFSTPPTFPVTITYTVNRRVQDAQNVFSAQTNAPFNYQEPLTDLAAIETPILVKQAPTLQVEYTASITVLPGFSKAQVIAQVQNNLATYSSGLALGQTVYLTDINEIVEKTAGVLRLTGTPTKFAPRESSGVLNSITPAKNQYVQLTNINIF